MIKFLGATLAIFVLGYFGTFIGWWGIVVVAAVTGFIVQIQGGLSFLSGLLGGALFFGLYTYYLDNANGGQLSGMMTEVLKFNPFLPTVAIGALLAGLGMLTGKYARDAFFGEQKKPKYRGRYR
ncbi:MULTISPECIES: hypothetical protein [unclassified Aureispira]|uniref:hypothetical protein n=1 Tax=unclassified Aureispira TaxID=2649989 RepID=UPI0006991E33|nr:MULTISPECIES: hypothetical protein [unclassified Aureispira]WMX13009.1 hypothetical protein QP953_19405 [Aureispira sp. CCB-E]